MREPAFVHRFIPAKAPSARTLLLLHGTGGDENDLIEFGRALDPDAAILSPRGQVLENGAPRFFRRLAEGVFDEADVIARAHELAEFVTGAAEQYEIDLKNLVAVGYSNGANIAGAMLLLGVANFSQAILFRAMVPLSQVDPHDLKHVRVLISAGQLDPIASPPIVRKLTDLFREAGAQVALHFQPAGHELIPQDMVTARQWLADAR